MVKAIYIRHGNDEEKDVLHEHRHDPHISEKSKTEAQKLSKRLVKEYGVPDIVYTSPIKRARITAKVMTEGMETRIIIDKRIARYFTKRNKHDVSVNPTTAKYINPQEDWNEFKRRIDSHFKSILRMGGSEQVIWIMTHVLIFKRLGQSINFGFKCPRSIPFLWTKELEFDRKYMRDKLAEIDSRRSRSKTK